MSRFDLFEEGQKEEKGRSEEALMLLVRWLIGWLCYLELNCCVV